MLSQIVASWLPKKKKKTTSKSKGARKPSSAAAPARSRSRSRRPKARVGATGAVVAPQGKKPTRTDKRKSAARRTTTTMSRSRSRSRPPPAALPSAAKKKASAVGRTKKSAAGRPKRDAGARQQAQKKRPRKKVMRGGSCPDDTGLLLTSAFSTQLPPANSLLSNVQPSDSLVYHDSARVPGFGTTVATGGLFDPRNDLIKYPVGYGADVQFNIGNGLVL
jgi:hypothetical protein